jgi:hypothetical protein
MLIKHIFDVSHVDLKKNIAELLSNSACKELLPLTILITLNDFFVDTFISLSFFFKELDCAPLKA